MVKKTTEYYLKILGVPITSTKEEIRAAYHNAIKQWHPDRFINNEQKILEATEKSKLINEAYQELKNYSPPIPKRSKSYTEHIIWWFSDRGNRNIIRSSINDLLVHSVGYDEVEKILQIKIGESLYEYYGVPEYVYNELIKAESPYKYYNKDITWSYPGGRVGTVSRRETPPD